MRSALPAARAGLGSCAALGLALFVAASFAPGLAGAAEGDLPGTAQTDSPEVSVGVVNTLSAEARLDNGNLRTDDDDFGLFIDRLNVAGNTDRVSLSLRLDSVVFAHTPTTAPFENDVRLERATAELHLGQVTLTVGDMYRQLGRGILLSLRKVDEIGLDVLLRGAETRWTPDGHSIAVFGGAVNSVNIDTISAKPLQDTGDVLAGASYELSAIDGVNVGLHALYLQPSERLLDTLDYDLSAGATVELPELISGLSVYGEVALQERVLAGGSELGTAAYLTADVSLGDLGLLFEGLRIGDFEEKGSRNTVLGSRFDYNLPPTLERLDQEVTASTDVTGGRVRAEVPWLDGALLTHANAMLRVNDLGKPTELRQLHGYVGAELRFDADRSSKVAVSGGYRDERNDAARVKSMAHFEVDLVKGLGPAWSVHLASNNELRTLQDRGYARGSTFLGAHWARTGSLTFELGYDTQDPSPEVRHLFFAGILGVDASEVISARLTGGTQRGGLKCVAGNCRDLPAFSGVKTELVIRL